MKNNFLKSNLIDCYWAGFIAADGCVTERNVLAICLSRKDIKHLESFKKYMNSNRKIYKNPKNSNTQLEICSKKIVKDLKYKFNIGPRKSLTYIPPNNLNIKQSLAFIVGYIDGDGCLSFNTRKYQNTIYKYIRLRILGTPATLSWINTIFNKNAKILRHGKSKIHIVSYNDKKLLQTLKSFITIHKLPVLKRKWNKIS